ncbi:rho-related protein rac1B-like [Lineus longissimus]|uniref:rho-related protein rac1B-like n=1 Tax=Lineus longissimus TaxID=88925 RepID=UPI002B4E24F6
MPPQLLEHSSTFLSDGGPSTDSNDSASSTGGDSSTHRDSNKVKCVLIGDGAIGKTSLIVSYTTNGYPTEYVPTAFDNYSVEVTVDHRPVQLQLCDTAGQDDFDAIRPLCYPGTDIFLLCFSVVSPASFNNTLEKWHQEVRHCAPGVPVILVGTQCDLRSDVKVLIELSKYGEVPVPEDQILDTMEDIGALKYIECSALTQKNLKEVFDTAILTALNWNGYRRKLVSRGTGSKKSQKKRKKSLREDRELIPAPGDQSKPRRSGWKKYLCVT